MAVFKGKKPIHACPYLDKEVIERYGGAVETPNTVDEYKTEAIEQLKQKISLNDLSEAAKRLGVRFSNNKLTIKILGKDFSGTGQQIVQYCAEAIVIGANIDRMRKGRPLQPKACLSFMLKFRKKCREMPYFGSKNMIGR